MNLRILSIFVAYVVLECCSADEEFCNQLKDATDKCTDVAKHPLIGNCTSYYKCDALANGRMLHETLTDCAQNEYFDRTKLECQPGTPDQIANCDQKKCETNMHSAGVDNLSDNRQDPRYANQGGGQPGGPPYPPNQSGGPPYPPAGGQDQRYPPGTGPSGGSGYGNQPPYNGQPTGNPDRGNPYDGQDGKGQHGGHGGNEVPNQPRPEDKDKAGKEQPKKDGPPKKSGTPSLSSSLSFVFAAMLFICTKNF